ncbi:mariner mos1 transposase [Plakobranchus ocellatus]|uniref:Mariner mos1 transposase n=1 Tax=Plakobranchus ocellatus TaxID=259542 RepID=A0AAV4C444_9GAST|nr:mariner mos1 transposase [Plakobranchus ocellatus]
MVNGQYYKVVIQGNMRTAISKQQPVLIQSGVIFHNDKAPVHTARMVSELLDEYKWSVLGHPRVSPDLAPCDFWLFPKMKERGPHRFESKEDVIFVTKEVIKQLDKVTTFDGCLQMMQKCIDNSDFYVE